MKCTICGTEMVKGVLHGRSGMIWIPEEEYQKKGLERFTRNNDMIVEVGRLERGDQIIDEMYYCNNCHIILGQIAERV